MYPSFFVLAQLTAADPTAGVDVDRITEEEEERIAHGETVTFLMPPAASR
jgi:hypothetical protein